MIEKYHKSVEGIHVFDNGIKVFNNHLVDLQRDRYQIANIHEPEEEEWFLKCLNEIDVANESYIDIGAAIGYYVILALKTKPGLDVHACEPLELHRQYMKENILLNGLPLDQITIYSDAISDRIGESRFFEADYGSSLINKTGIRKIIKGSIKKLLRRKVYNPPKKKTSLVKTRTLDSIIDKKGLTFGLVQIDVQGFEMNVLRGAKKALKAGRVHQWIVGTHSMKLHQTCIDYLIKHKCKICFEKADPEIQPDGIIVARTIL